MKDLIDGAMEHCPKPCAVTVEEQMQHVVEFATWKANGSRDGIAEDPSKVHGIKQLSILYALLY